MNLFRKRNGNTTPVAADAGAPVAGTRNCRGCGDPLEADQLACLSCGAVDSPAAGRERRWMLRTGGVAGAALLLVTSASFATTTALRTGDPKAVKEQPPAVAQAPIPPASGNGAAPGSATAPDEPGKGPDLGDLPDPPASDPAPPAGGGGGAPPADDAPDDAGADDGGDAGNPGADAGSGASPGGSGGGSGGSEPKKPDKPPVTVREWEDGLEAYTVIPGYKFNTKSEARAKAREIKEAGLPAGIIDSDKYRSLEPGSWLVFIGEFASMKAAERANNKYSNAGYPGEPTRVSQEDETPEAEPDAGTDGGAKPKPAQP